MRHADRLALTVGLALICAGDAQAQQLKNRLYPKFELDIDGTLLRLSETLRIDPKNRPELGTEISVEDVLGISRSTLQPRATFRWRPWRRHEFEVGFQRVVRSAEEPLPIRSSFATPASRPVRTSAPTFEPARCTSTIASRSRPRKTPRSALRSASGRSSCAPRSISLRRALPPGRTPRSCNTPIRRASRGRSDRSGSMPALGSATVVSRVGSTGPLREDQQP